MGDFDFTEAEGEEAFKQAEDAIRQRRIDAVAKAIQYNIEEAERVATKRKNLDDLLNVLVDSNEKLKAGDEEMVRRAVSNSEQLGHSYLTTPCNTSHITMNASKLAIK